MKSMVQLLIWLFAGVMLLVGALFALANRQSVVVSLDPFSSSQPLIALPAMPLWFLLLFFLMFGFFVGAIAMWSSSGGVRRKARQRRHEIQQLRKEVSEARDEIKAAVAKAGIKEEL